MKILMKRSRKKLKNMEIEILNLENTKKFFDEK
jgi:hypothetical protein